MAAGLARRCEIELAYAIGVARPVSLLVDTQGTGVLPDEKLAELVAQAQPERLGGKQRLYYEALRLLPASSILLP